MAERVKSRTLAAELILNILEGHPPMKQVVCISIRLSARAKRELSTVNYPYTIEDIESQLLKTLALPSFFVFGLSTMVGSIILLIISAIVWCFRLSLRYLRRVVAILTT